LILTPPDDEEARRAAQGAFEELLTAAIALGGTVSGEHGIGLLKRGGMQRELQTEVLAIQLALKNMFDPMDLFNPGKVTGTPAVL
jgi:glycolate oxidase